VEGNDPGYKLMEKVNAMSAAEIEEYYLRSISLSRQAIDSRQRIPYLKDNKLSNRTLKRESLSAMPADAIIPAEYEESQAVLISWPAFAFDSTGAMINSFLPGIGIKYDKDSLIYVPIAYYLLDLIEQSPIPETWKEMTRVIQKECPVWIRVPSAKDTTELKDWLEKKGCPLYNYKFIVSPEGVNQFWMRDCAPIGFYYSRDDSIGFIDNVYYPATPIDDELPALLSEKTGYGLFKSNLEIEGGNFMTDGIGNGFFSDIIYNANGDTTGPAFKYKKPQTKEETERSLDDIFNLKRHTVLNYLKCDGGTGHIDFYLKLIDEHTIVYTQYPESYNNPEFEDYRIIENNIARLNTLQDPFGRPYNLVALPLPVNIEFRTYDDTTCSNFKYYHL
jgi:agmatine/peptidylarginine deiminase